MKNLFKIKILKKTLLVLSLNLLFYEAQSQTPAPALSQNKIPIPAQLPASGPIQNSSTIQLPQNSVDAKNENQKQAPVEERDYYVHETSSELLKLNYFDSNGILIRKAIGRSLRLPERDRIGELQLLIFAPNAQAKHLSDHGPNPPYFGNVFFKGIYIVYSVPEDGARKCEIKPGAYIIEGQGEFNENLDTIKGQIKIPELNAKLNFLNSVLYGAINVHESIYNQELFTFRILNTVHLEANGQLVLMNSNTQNQAPQNQLNQSLDLSKSRKQKQAKSEIKPKNLNCRYSETFQLGY